MKIRVPGKNEEVTRATFSFHCVRKKLKEAELRDGQYLLRTNLVAEDPAVLWDPTPRKKEEVPVWIYLSSELTLKLHGAQS